MSRALANQERDAQFKRMSRFGRSTLMLIATALTFATFCLLATDQLYRPDTFVIDQLKIKGAFNYLQPEQIEDAVKEQAIGNFFSIELARIKRRVEDVEWVQSAEVRREWPNSLTINIQEQRPVMRWNNDRWVNSSGDIIELEKKITLAQPITLSGNESNSRLMFKQALAWKQLLNKHDIELLGLNLSDRKAYSLKLRQLNTKSEFELLLGRERVEQRLARFIALFDYKYQQPTRRLERVDARYPDGLAIKSVPLSVKDMLALNRPQIDSQTGDQQ